MSVSLALRLLAFLCDLLTLPNLFVELVNHLSVTNIIRWTPRGSLDCCVVDEDHSAWREQRMRAIMRMKNEVKVSKIGRLVCIYEDLEHFSSD